MFSSSKDDIKRGTMSGPSQEAPEHPQLLNLTSSITWKVMTVRSLSSLVSRTVVLEEKFFNVRQPTTSESKRRATHSEERKKG
jgi:hypothetical protein